jgi:hypothetical protein
MFLILSILTCLFDFPVFLQYIYHISAYVGFLQLWVNYAFFFSEETRFFICLAYLIIGLANIIFVNGYVGFRNKKILWTTSFLCCVTIPSTVIGFSAVSWYVNKMIISLPLLPLVPPEIVVAVLVMCAFVLAIGIIVSMFGFRFPGTPVPKTKRGRR